MKRTAAIIRAAAEATLGQFVDRKEAEVNLDLGTARAIANNAAQALAGSPRVVLDEILSELDALEIQIARMPAGHYALDIQADSPDQVHDIAIRLGMPEPTWVSSETHTWLSSALGDYGFERVTVIGGRRAK